MTLRGVPKKYLVVAGTAFLLTAAVVAGVTGSDDGAPESALPSVAVSPTSAPSSEPVTASPPAPETVETEPSDAGALPSDGSVNDVDVMVVFIGWEPATNAVEATGYAAAIDAGGDCVLTLTRGSEIVKSEPVAAAIDAAAMSCGTVAIPRANLQPGTWQATLSYSSPAYSGTSVESAVEVPE